MEPHWRSPTVVVVLIAFEPLITLYTGEFEKTHKSAENNTTVSDSGLVGVGRESCMISGGGEDRSLYHQDTFSSLFQSRSCNYVNDNLFSTWTISFAGLSRVEVASMV
jgi:hypothetical protein